MKKMILMVLVAIVTSLFGVVEVESVVYPDTIIVAGIDDVIAQQFIVTNNEADEINISSISMKALGTGNCTEYGYFTLAPFLDGMQQGSSKNLNSEGTLTFNDLSVVVSAGEQKEFFIVMNTAETLAPGTIRFSVTSIVVDNIETGSPIVVMNSGFELGETNPLEGVVFTLIEHGTLTLTESDFLITGQRVVLSGCLHAQDDEVQVMDLYFKNVLHSDSNNVGPLADFKLYGPDSTLIQMKQMQSDGSLHFELPNQLRIAVPKNDSTYFAIVMDLRNTFEESEKHLQLALDVSHATKGIKAITGATGNDIPTPEQGWGELISEEIVVSTISGPQSGVWEKGLYMVSDDISVAVVDTLTLSEGVEIVFPDGVKFSINGVLHAEEAVLIEGGEIEIAGFVEIADSEVRDVLFTVTDGGQLNLIRTTVHVSRIDAVNAVLYLGGCKLFGTDDISVSGGSIIVMGSEFHDYEIFLENLSRMEIQWNNFMSTPGIVLRMVGDFDGEFIRNNIFFNNGTAIHAETSSVFELSHNCFFGNLFDLNEGEGVVDFGVINTTNVNGDPSDQHFNIFLNPQFGDAENGNYNLMFGSPCIGAGSDGDDIGAHSYDPSGIETNEEKVPDEVQLHQNYPNPFNPVTTIEFTLNTEMKVSLSVYNVAGEKVARLVNNRNMTQGSHAVPFNAVGLTSGIYYYILEAQNVVITNKMVLTK